MAIKVLLVGSARLAKSQTRGNCMKLSFIAATAGLAVLLAASPGIASADVITGTAYFNIASPSGSTQQGSGFAVTGVTLATLAAAEASSNGSSTFVSNAINYDGPVQSSTLTSFLTSDAGNTTITGTIPAGQLAVGTLLVLTGDVFLTNGMNYTILHDDGINLYIGALGGSPTDLILAQGAQTTID